MRKKAERSGPAVAKGQSDVMTDGTTAAKTLCPFAVSAATPLAISGATPQHGAAAFVALSKFVVANGMMAEVKEAFRNRPHLVDDAPGVVKMEVMVPFDNPNELWLVTYWADEGSYRIWHHSHEYHESHKGIPKGLKLVPRSAEIRLFEFICS